MVPDKISRWRRNVSGTLFLVGLGPGDPELVTRKGANLLARAPVIAFPQKAGSDSRALGIARSFLSPKAVLLPLELTMQVDPEPAARAYGRIGEQIAEHLQADRDVAYLCEGDPFLYGSAMYVFERLARDFPVETIPGITSFSAAAAAAAQPLVSREQSLLVLAGTAEKHMLEQRLKQSQPAVILKAGRHLPALREILQRCGRFETALLACNVSLPDQQIMPLADWTQDTLPYFSLILCPRPARRAEKDRQERQSTAKKSPAPAVLWFTRAGAEVAERIADELDATRIGPQSMGEGAGNTLRELFLSGTPIIGVCATGILVRQLAPVLQDKHADPPVIAVSADGRHVVPVLGGHHGANRLAERIAARIGGNPAITTASDSRFSFALDEPPPGFVLADARAAPAAMAAVLDGEELQVSGDAGWLEEAGYPVSATGSVPVRVSERMGEGDPKKELTFHPRTLIAGVGCVRGVDAGEVVSLVRNVLKENHLAEASLAAIASINIKSDEKGLHEAAAQLGVPARFLGAEQLRPAAAGVPNPSPVVEAEVGVASVAEAAASLAGELIVPKTKSFNATCAIARAHPGFDREEFGRPRGQLHLVGIGPGEAAQRTASATAALKECPHWVGYSMYLDLVEEVREGQQRHESALGEEEKRVRHALELAGRGNRVALVCSGDAQIFAMAALVYELLDATGSRAVSGDARRVAIESHPGVSALQVASARAGALLGNDFCAISLSDLLTPASAIEQRIRAAAGGDFVTAFYNPRSSQRTRLLETAISIFREFRPPTTPVVVASRLGRPGETVVTVPLSRFDPSRVDMLTIVLVGAFGSRMFARGDGSCCAYTPRGYAAKGSIEKGRVEKGHAEMGHADSSGGAT
ncbi:MAG TPA: precorrin-3B C(17)-methyltransferase [Devosia sp.]|nr:precorrin-3B C(17)-methyltransferase [Devosia sp.]